ncbi:MAG: glutamine-hydrolyzing carbamoyl-phosphate synthase small subunit [Bacteroidota bacterium]
MKYHNRDEAVLLLADGTFFRGASIGKKGTSGGEICFNTGMTGYQEIYTDPSYYGQIMVNSTAHIGNYGVHPDEQESDKAKIFGLVVNRFSDQHSRINASESLQAYMEANDLVGIAEVDTRMLVRHIRSKGAMNAIISTEILDPEALMVELKKVPDMEGLELSSEVTTKEPYTMGEGNGKKVAVLDLGIKSSILKNLVERDCECKVFPAKTSFADMKAWGADGYFISNGPGDPSAMDYAVNTVKEILDEDQPVFGICMGHQILARAVDISTYKMHHGHRGINHPVKNLESGLGEITSQNHGFAVSGEELEVANGVEVTHVNLNDQTIEGLKLTNKKAFSVQYHPESSPGPHDSRYLFDKFVQLMNA